MLREIEWLACAWLLIGFLGLSDAHGALFANASFETVPGTGPAFLGQGLLPSQWFDSTNTLPGADTYSADNSYGLTAGDFHHFLRPFTSYDGHRWVAGVAFATGEREGISQLLPFPLVPGQEYEFEAAVTDTTLFGSAPPTPGGWELMLSPDTTFTNPGAVSMGTLAANQLDTWQLRTLIFTAPANAASLPHILLVPYTAVPGQLAYVGIDGPIAIDDAPTESSPIPEPATLPAWAVALIAAGCALRRAEAR